MASPNELCSSGSEQEQAQVTLDEKKRKRMESNRESARRSRMRKQKQSDDLTDQVSLLTERKSKLVSSLSVTRNFCLSVETENSVLRTQVLELSNRLNSLNLILSRMDFNGLVADPWNLGFVNQGLEMYNYC